MPGSGASPVDRPTNLSAHPVDQFSSSAPPEHLRTLIDILPNLQGLTLPQNILDDFPSLLDHVSATSSLGFAPSDRFGASSVLTLSRGFNRFNQLHTIALGGAAFSASHLRLARLPGLKEMHINTLISGFQGQPPSATQGDFLALRTLEITGSLSDLITVMRACCNPSTTVLRRIVVTASFLTHPEEMKQALRTISERCPRIKELKISINCKNTTRNEDAKWMDLQGLLNFDLENFSVEHPLPLSLSDDFVAQLLEAWTRPQLVSLNPYPSSAARSASYLPTWMCISYFADKPSLDYFGMYLNFNTRVGPCILRRRI
jgi:hypothetical protein